MATEQVPGGGGMTRPLEASVTGSHKGCAPSWPDAGCSALVWSTGGQLSRGGAGASPAPLLGSASPQMADVH